ncbi:hypothetical protein [Streptomyces sp. CC219B]|nr:hypothetical protein [Streptomyces sp. CC219B]
MSEPYDDPARAAVGLRQAVGVLDAVEAVGDLGDDRTEAAVGETGV